MQYPIQYGAYSIGGVESYPLNRLHEEVACIAFYFHWSLEDILNLEHFSRQRWLTEIRKIRNL